MEEFKTGQTIESRLFVVLMLPIDNRTNKEEVLFQMIQNIIDKYDLKGKCDFTKI